MSVRPGARISSNLRSHARLARLAATAVLGTLLAACNREPAAPPSAPAASPPVTVGVVTAAPGTLGLVSELPGRTEASRVAQVRARAAGILLQRTFREGSDVKAGQVLFRIDAAPYAAAMASAQAALAKSEANLAQAAAQAARYKPLLEANAVSQQEYVSAVAAQKQAEADVAAGKAAVQAAQINLGYATVTAPIGGRIGRALVTEGALVGQGEATQLALVQQIDPMYVNFTQPVADVLRLRAAIASGKLKSAGGDAAAVKLVLDDGTVYPLAGRLLFSDLSVDPTSSQITLRAEVSNPKGLLLPGMFVRARLEQAAVSGGIPLPQQAVQRGSNGDVVMVVGSDGKVSPRPVKIGPGQNGTWVVLEGLQAGEQVMVDGFQKLRGPVTVRPVPWSPPGASPPSPAGPAASALPSAPTASAAKP